MPDEKIAQVAIDFIAFCFERRGADWPVLYDEMCFVAGKRLYRTGTNCKINGYQAVKFHGTKRDCLSCPLRERGLKHPERTKTRQVHFFEGCAQCALETYTQKMKRKIDSVFGRFVYSWRLATAEPVFANITRTRGLNRFTAARQAVG